MQRRHFLLGLACLTLSTRISAGESLPGKIYAVEYASQFRSIVVIDPNTGKRRRLMKTNRQEEAPRVSPDGKTLLFACADPESDWHIRKLDLVSGKESPLVESDSWPVCWVDDRQFIANIGLEYWLCQADGVRVRKLADSGGSPVSGSLASNGEFFYTLYGEPSQLLAMHLASGAIRKLGPGSDPICSHGMVLFQGRDGFRQTRLGGGRASLVAALQQARHAAFSPDGRFLAWSQDSGTGSRLVLGTRDFRELRSFSGTSLNGLFWGG